MYDVIDDSGALVIVMEYIEGMSLRDGLAQGPCGVAESIRICMTAADALGHAHDAGVVHCDIKPANIQLLYKHKLVFGSQTQNQERKVKLQQVVITTEEGATPTNYPANSSTRYLCVRFTDH